MKEQIPKLDKKDKMLMHELETNARASFNEIGKKIGLSGETVEYRLQRMKKLGLINRIFAEPDMAKLGLKTYRLYLKVQNLSEKDEKEFINYFSSHPRCQWYAEFEGEWDYTVRYAMENEAALKNEIDAFMAKFGKFIKAKDIVITSYQTYLPITYFTGGERNPRLFELEEKQEIEEIDDIDRKLLFYIIEDARIKTVELAGKVKLSTDAVQYRIRKLTERGVIAFFTTWFDRRKLGYEYYKILFWFQFATKEDEEKLIRYCEQHPNIVFINRVLGNWDLEIDFDARSTREIHEFVKDLKNRFSNIIRDHTTLAILRDGIGNPFKS